MTELATLHLGIESYLKGWVQLRNGQPSFEAWLLANGERMGPVVKRPKGLRLMTKKQCFSNASRVAIRNTPEGFVYCEGYVVSPNLGIPIHHGWLANQAGEVMDVTLRDAEGSAYFGVPFTRKYLTETMARTGYYGVFSPNGCSWNQELMSDEPSAFRAWPKTEDVK